jgi:signal transduction histidine kinase
VLTTLGLVPAVQAMALRCAIPVELEESLGERPAPAVETALYYTVAETLTNVDR